jgi:hypothetical protein
MSLDKGKLQELKAKMILWKVDPTKIEHMYEEDNEKQLTACVSCNRDAKPCLVCDQCPGCCLSGVNLCKNFWTIEEFERDFEDLSR